MPAGDEVMAPGAALPCRLTVTPNTCLKVPVTEWLAVIKGLHVVGTAPVQSCVQPVNLTPGAAAGVSVSIVPYGNTCAHGVVVSSHANAPGPVTLPLPTTVTFSVLSWIEKLAATAMLSVLALNEQGAVPGQLGSPLQPMKSQPVTGAGVSFTSTLRVNSK